jgi:predicted DNA-binding transcriptional regulator AlpA
MGTATVDTAGTTSQLFDRKTLAEFLLVSTRTLDRLDVGNKLPPAIRIGAAKRWPRSVIDEWLRQGCPSRGETVAPGQGCN